jgi:hypothetical protein
MQVDAATELPSVVAPTERQQPSQVLSLRYSDRVRGYKLECGDRPCRRLAKRNAALLSCAILPCRRVAEIPAAPGLRPHGPFQYSPEDHGSFLDNTRQLRGARWPGRAIQASRGMNCTATASWRERNNRPRVGMDTACAAVSGSATGARRRRGNAA